MSKLGLRLLALVPVALADLPLFEGSKHTQVTVPWGIDSTHLLREHSAVLPKAGFTTRTHPPQGTAGRLDRP
jgi:hypothetical protein